jgi:hypothetical protein
LNLTQFLFRILRKNSIRREVITEVIKGVYSFKPQYEDSEEISVKELKTMMIKSHPVDCPSEQSDVSEHLNFYFNSIGMWDPRIYASDISLKIPQKPDSYVNLHRRLTMLNRIESESGGEGIIFPTSLFGQYGATFAWY